jgi:hypothetical protein
MKMYEGMEIQMHIFITVALYGGEWLGFLPLPLHPQEETH